MIIVTFIAIIVMSGLVFTEQDFIHFEERLFVVFSFALNGLYLLGVFIIIFGAFMMASRYVRAKLKSPFEPAKLLFHASYLTIGLEILIGAEIVATAISQTVDDFIHLALIIGIRFIIALLIYVERKMEIRPHHNGNGNGNDKSNN